MFFSDSSSESLHKLRSLMVSMVIWNRHRVVPKLPGCLKRNPRTPCNGDLATPSVWILTCNCLFCQLVNWLEREPTHAAHANSFFSQGALESLGKCYQQICSGKKTQICGVFFFPEARLSTFFPWPWYESNILVINVTLSPKVRCAERLVVTLFTMKNGCYIWTLRVLISRTHISAHLYIHIKLHTWLLLKPITPTITM